MCKDVAWAHQICIIILTCTCFAAYFRYVCDYIICLLWCVHDASTHNTSNLNSDFTCEINETFTLKIVQWPESIKLEIFESGLITSTLISEVYVPIPDPLLTIDSVGGGHEMYQFSSTKKVEYGHTAVGSGMYNIRVSCCMEIPFKSTWVRAIICIYSAICGLYPVATLFLCKIYAILH